MFKNPILPTPEKVRRRRSSIKSFKAKANQNRKPFEKFADFLTSFFGTITFFVGNTLFFVFWIVWNIGYIPSIPIIDPYPFFLLTTFVSLEAIFLAIIVLISQNREAKIAELREEVELYINTYAESEITKVMYLLTLLLEKHGIDISHDKDLQKMLKSLESEAIERELESQL